MFKTVAEFDKTMYSALCQIRDGSRLKELKLDCSDSDALHAIKECVDRGYLEGVSFRVTASGYIASEGDLFVTYSGLQYLEAHKA